MECAGGYLVVAVSVRFPMIGSSWPPGRGGFPNPTVNVALYDVSLAVGLKLTVTVHDVGAGLAGDPVGQVDATIVNAEDPVNRIVRAGGSGASLPPSAGFVSVNVSISEVV